MADIVVAGSGVAGQASALFLARAGHHVTIVEPDPAQRIGPGDDTAMDGNPLFLRKVCYPMALHDPGLPRPVLRRIHLFDRPDALPRDRALPHRARARFTEQPRPAAAEPPSLDALLATLARRPAAERSERSERSEPSERSGARR